MKYFITGSTGFIGRELTKRLAASGNEVHILVRSMGKAQDLQLQGVTIFTGDVTEQESLENAMEGCSYVFHLAALAKPFAPDPHSFLLINVGGTENVLKAALAKKVKKVVFTSSAGTFRPSSPEVDVDELSESPEEHFTDYAQTKAMAERICLDYVRKGLNVVIVNPSRVFGPGLMTSGNSFTWFITLYIRGKWHIIPGNGQTYGNYVFVNDVVEGHLLAMESGKSGEKYILGGENKTYIQIFDALDKVTGHSHFKIKIPLRILQGIAYALVIMARIRKKEPFITPAWVSRYLQHRRLTSLKAERELGYKITPFNDALRKTILWINQTKKG